jgi:hypothetical protein
MHVCIRAHLYDAVLSEEPTLTDEPESLAVRTCSFQHFTLTPYHKKHFVADFAL